MRSWSQQGIIPVNGLSGARASVSGGLARSLVAGVAVAACLLAAGGQAAGSASASSGPGLAGRVTAVGQVRVVTGGAGSQLWLSSYNGPNHGFDAATAAVASPDGRVVFVTGGSAGTHAADDYATVAYDSVTGAQLWVSRYNGPGGSIDMAFAIGISPGGGTVYVTGESIGTGSISDFNYATIAYDAQTGAQKWLRRYSAPHGSVGAAKALAVSPGGRTVYVTGYNGAGPGRYDYVTVAYNSATGARRWVSRYNGRVGGNDQAHAVAVSPDGRTVYVTGRSQGTKSGYDIATIAYNAATGARRWAARYNGPFNLNDFGHSLAVSPGGHVLYVTGGSRAPGNQLGFVTIAYTSSAGKALWASRTRGALVLHDIGSLAGVTPDGRTVVVANYTAGTTTRTAYATTAYNARTGVTRWSRRYSGSEGGGNDNVPAALGISPDGTTAYVTGTSDDPPSGRRTFATIAYQIATGTRLWVSRPAGVDVINQTNAIAVNPKGGAVYVTGSNELSLVGIGDYVTIAYRTS